MYPGLGMTSLCGDVDFFPNGGETQPGCNKSVLTIADNIVRLRVEGTYRKQFKFKLNRLN